MSDFTFIKEAEKAKHIVIKCEPEYFPQASVLYSYFLTKHKKVTLFMPKESSQFSFLAWYEKRRTLEIQSADCNIDANVDILTLYSFLKKEELTINKKMATALYAAILKRYDNFTVKNCDGTLFAIVSELINSGADHDMCITRMYGQKPLSFFRLKALVYKKFLLKENASVIEVVLSESDFQESGASWEMLKEIAKELLKVVHVHEVRIMKSDEKDKILIIKEV